MGIALVGVLGLLAAACSSGSEATGDQAGGADIAAPVVPEGPPIVIGAQDFGESAILAEIYRQVLAQAGYPVSIQSLGGYRDISMGAFESGDINFAPEYVASLLEFLNDKAGEASGDLDETFSSLEQELSSSGLVALEPAPGINTNAFVVTAETAETFGLASLSDLANVSDQLTLGGPADCATNPFCLPGLESVYGVDLSDGFVGLDSGVVATALTSGEIDVALLFSTDGRIQSEGWVLLEDDRSMLAADNIVPVVTTGLVEAYGEDMATLVNAVSAKLTTAVLTELNRQYDVDKRDAREIAAAWLEANPIG